MNNGKSLFLALFGGVCIALTLVATGALTLRSAPALAQAGFTLPPQFDPSNFDPSQFNVQDLQNSTAFQNAFPNGLPPGVTIPNNINVPSILGVDPSNISNLNLANIPGVSNIDPATLNNFVSSFPTPADAQAFLTSLGTTQLNQVSNLIQGFGSNNQLSNFANQLQNLPAGFDVSAISGLVGNLPNGVNLNNLASNLQGLAPNIDLGAVSGLLSGLPNGADLSAITNALSGLNPGASLAQVQSQLQGLLPAADIQALAGQLQNLPANFDLSALPNVMQLIPNGINPAQFISSLQGLSGLNPQALAGVLGNLPAGLNPAQLASALQGFAGVNPQALASAFSNLPAGLNPAQLGNLLQGFPAGISGGVLGAVAGGLLSGNVSVSGVISQASCSVTYPSCQGLPGTVNSDYCEMRDNILQHISDEFTEHRNWFSDTFLPSLVVPALQRFTEQMTATAMLQTFSIGTFFDAKHQLETQRTFQELQFQAHKDYQPSKEFCQIGTAVRSMAHTESAGRYTALAFARRQMARHLGNKNVGGASSAVEDKINRWQQFRTTYCDPQDNNWIGVPDTGLTAVCQNGVPNSDRINIDVDYTRLIENKRTLNIFAPHWIGAEDEIDILSLGNNLYGHELITRDISAQNIDNEELAGQYLKLRSIAAKRSVAENSFNAIIGMKALGSTMPQTGTNVETWRYLGRILQDLGIPEEEVVDYLGLNTGVGSIGPANSDLSHFAQLEVLAKKIYQNPNFYAGLYDTPANIKRKSAALKAIELMLDRAIYESQLRQEMSMSVLLSARLQSSVDSVSSDLGAQ